MYEAVVLAGGYGTRLRQAVSDVPKPMAPIRGRPFLEIQLSLLARNGFDHAVLAVGHLGHVIMSHFGDRYEGIELSYNVEHSPLGTGGAIAAALEKCRGEGVFVFNGDTYLDLNCDAAYQLWKKSRRGVIVGRQVPDTARYGRLMAKSGLVHGVCEKGEEGPGVINAGCYVLTRVQFVGMRRGLPFSFENDYLAHQLATAPLDLFVTTGLFIDIGVPEDFHRAQDLLPER
jgi:D-glycero-alpha-D-manno-heptose 1-phosphate guanylyltransferase